MIRDPKVSIIIPVYNSEKYLPNCIDSLLVQTYKNLEIILINDGSTDGSAAICDNYAKNDHRVFVLHKSNEGSSSARNAGLKFATGDFIGFVDSDDFILDCMYFKLLNHVITNKLDIAFCNFTSASSSFSEIITDETPRVISIDKYLQRMEFHPHGVFNVWNKLIKSDLAKSTEFIHGKIHQDALYMSEILQKSNRIGQVPESLYIYNDLNKSVTRSKFNNKKLEGIEVVIRAHSNLLKISKSERTKNAVKKWYSQWLIGRYALLSRKRGSMKWRNLRSLVKSELEDNYKINNRDLRIELIQYLPSRIFGLVYTGYMKIIRKGKVQSI
ncbi:glycosyltransferase [Robiginitalea aurantiaca]|uniref:Glycosyltransferase n=1 Tax=Robiginitalea aurantiaca TaxID=3056915 RepID=A0ABT7WIS5_9FLAO|nr:glycosyltransferase [Robiginitalea aurantiaca]MDM9632800.1 glycosyltransferase [Robiginitalea aurantiaca]